MALGSELSEAGVDPAVAIAQADREHAQGSRRWDKVLLCCTRASLNSWWVDNEINATFEKERQFMKERGAQAQILMPLNLDDCLFSDEWQSVNDLQLQSRVVADFAKNCAGEERLRSAWNIWLATVAFLVVRIAESWIICKEADAL